MGRVIKRVGIVGCGTAGAGIALEFALNGFDVVVCTTSPASSRRAIDRVSDMITQLIECGLVEPSALGAAYQRIHATADLAGAAGDLDYVVEAVPEDLDLKRGLIASIGAWTGADLVIASATTALPIDELALDCPHPERVIGTRYTHPAHLLPIVDVVRGERTSDETVRVVRDLLDGLGKKSVVVERGSVGAVGQRLLAALMGEAFRLVDEGVAAPATIDEVVTTGFGRRLGATGIFDRADVAGLDAVAAMFGRRGSVPRVLAEKVAAGDLGRKSGRGFYRWLPDDAEAFDRREAQHLAAHLLRDRHVGSTTTRYPTTTVSLDRGVLDEFLAQARSEYLGSAPDSPPRCFAVLVGQAEGEVIHVRRAHFARTVRDADPAAASEWRNVIVPCFGQAYANERRGFWVNPADLLKIDREATADGLDVLGSVHLHPDWHRIGPPHERGMLISERPTPMDRYLFANAAWPLNMICYLERIGPELRHTMAAWGPPPIDDPSAACPELAVRHATPAVVISE